ncbi:MAG: aquaporin family protein [Rhizobiales bacterium]|nr:aquaporin family protein [Hyphomicrobiales bacterium]MBI3674267.1 aquaporin family protein [Hyphomicrobiales bacterium]
MPTSRRLAAEALGSALLLAAIVGSGIMAERLAGGNMAVALLENTIPTGAMLVVLITIFGPVSGAHFNPAMTLAGYLRRDIGGGLALYYVLAQMMGAVLGVLAAHLMFGLDLIQASTKVRSGGNQWFAEAVATFGLLTVIFGSVKRAPQWLAVNVGLYIAAAYWFTASTSFANPAVTLARSLTNTFSGIRPADAPAFIVAQLIGAGLAIGFDKWFNSKS